MFCNYALNAVLHFLSFEHGSDSESALHAQHHGNIASLLDVLSTDYAYIAFTLRAHDTLKTILQTLMLHGNSTNAVVFAARTLEFCMSVPFKWSEASPV